jgi:hypothetical protein
MAQPRSPAFVLGRAARDLARFPWHRDVRRVGWAIGSVIGLVLWAIVRFVRFWTDPLVNGMLRLRRPTLSELLRLVFLAAVWTVWAKANYQLWHSDKSKVILILMAVYFALSGFGGEGNDRRDVTRDERGAGAKSAAR